MTRTASIAALVLLPSLLIVCLVAKTRARGQTGLAIHYEELVPSGEVINQGGICDPSLQYDPAGNAGWLLYSAVHKSPRYSSIPVGPYIETRLAKSTDAGKSWHLVQALSRSRDDTVELYNGETLPGIWRYEVPTITYDPDDKGREWKLFAHRIAGNTRRSR